LGFNNPLRCRSDAGLIIEAGVLLSSSLTQNGPSMPRCSVTRRVHFNAAHRVHNPRFSEEWNRKIFGECNNPNFHGHNYELELTVEGEVDPDTGYVLDLNILKELAQERLLRHLDHRNLNLDVPWFRDLIPTSENIAIVCWRELRAALPETLSLRLRLWETPRNYVDYQGA
jgi:6-pyruvoyltetrahydropterin/6-carboxytetrahydropterin synthase